MAEPVLNSSDAQSAAWLKIKRHLEEKLAALRSRNDKDLDERKTQRLRGRIEEVKDLMALDKPAPSQQADDS